MRNPLRQHFPALHDDRHAYLDFAATALVARPVIEAVASEMQSPRGNPWRGAHAWSESATVRL
jgi:selenocysteine lyase/cysteine desulfurase